MFGASMLHIKFYFLVRIILVPEDNCQVRTQNFLRLGTNSSFLRLN